MGGAFYALDHKVVFTGSLVVFLDANLLFHSCLGG